MNILDFSSLNYDLDEKDRLSKEGKFSMGLGSVKYEFYQDKSLTKILNLRSFHERMHRAKM